jgi:dipeptidase E
MTARLLLVSSNIASPQMMAAAGRLTRGLNRGAIVTTAEIKLKERNRDVALAHATLLAVGVPHVELFDFDTRPATELAQFDFVYLASGNPFYLLKRVRETEADLVLEEMAASGRPIIGSGAGAVLLGRSIGLVRFFDSTVADLRWKDNAALGLAPFAALPHANRWRARFVDYRSRLASARTVCGCDIAELDDGDGLLVEAGSTIRVEADASLRDATSMPVQSGNVLRVRSPIAVDFARA